jgi:hypothetical protein
MEPWQVRILIDLLACCVVLHTKVITLSATEDELFGLIPLCGVVD